MNGISDFLKNATWWTILSCLFGLFYWFSTRPIQGQFIDYLTAFMLHKWWYVVLFCLVILVINAFIWKFFLKKNFSLIFKVCLPISLSLSLVVLYMHLHKVSAISLNVRLGNEKPKDGLLISHSNKPYEVDDGKIDIRVTDLIKCQCKRESGHVFTVKNDDLEIYSVDKIEIHSIDTEHSLYLQPFVKKLQVNSPLGNYKKKNVSDIEIDIDMKSHNDSQYDLHDPMWDVENHRNNKTEKNNSQLLRMSFNGGDNFYSTMNDKITGKITYSFRDVDSLLAGINKLAISVFSKYDNKKVITETSMFKLVDTVDQNGIKFPSDITCSDSSIKFKTRKRNVDSIFDSGIKLDLSRNHSVMYSFQAIENDVYSVFKIGEFSFRLEVGKERKIECRDGKGFLIKSDRPSDTLELELKSNTKYQIAIDMVKIRPNKVLVSIGVIDLKNEIQQGKVNYSFDLDTFNDIYQVPFYIGARRLLPFNAKSAAHFFEVTTIEFY